VKVGSCATPTEPSAGALLKPKVCSWHEPEVFGGAAIPLGSCGTSTVSTSGSTVPGGTSAYALANRLTVVWLTR
jgi:hypothetical protein